MKERGEASGDLTGGVTMLFPGTETWTQLATKGWVSSGGKLPSCLGEWDYIVRARSAQPTYS